MRRVGQKMADAFDDRITVIHEDLLSLHDLIKDLKSKTDTLTGQVTTQYEKRKTLKLKLDSIHEQTTQTIDEV